jgi:hypothetical protein
MSMARAQFLVVKFLKIITQQTDYTRINMVSVTFIQPNGLPCGIKWSAWTDPAWVDVPRTLLRARFRL